MTTQSVTVTYDEARAVVNTAPNTPGGIRAIRPFVDALASKDTWPVRLRLNRCEQAALLGLPRDDPKEG